MVRLHFRKVSVARDGLTQTRLEDGIWVGGRSIAQLKGSTAWTKQQRLCAE